MNEKPAKHAGGRPAIITLEVAEKIAKLIGLGMVEEDACLHLEVNYRSWVKAKERKPEFAEVIKKGRADYQAQALAAINSGADNWTSKAWILERRHGNQFKRTADVQIAQQFVVGFTAEEWQKVQRIADQREIEDGKTKEEPGSTD